MADIRVLDAPGSGGFSKPDDDECAVIFAKETPGDRRHSGPRSDSYSSVKEDLDGEPQSFFSGPRCGGFKLSGPAADRHGDSEILLQDEQLPQRGVKAAVGIGDLPVEILYRIFSSLTLDVPPSDYAPRNRDLVACLTVSRRLYPTAQAVLYRQVTFPHPLIFAKFFKLLTAQPEIGTLIRRLDLSHFTALGFGRTRKGNGEAQSFTSTTLLRCLDLLPLLREVLLQEHVEQDLSSEVLKKILLGLPHLRALDLCGAHKAGFSEAFSEAIRVLEDQPERMLSIERLSLHQCDTVSSGDLSILLSRLPRLRMLDLNHTQIDDEALLSIPGSARLSHLNLGRCSQITGPGVVDFLANHPAARDLQYLNLACDIARYRLLRTADVDELLPVLPSTLRSLNLNGAQIGSAHLPQLRRLVSFLEELGLGQSDLSLCEIHSLFEAPVLDDDDDDQDAVIFSGSSLRYIDLTSVASVTQASLFSCSSLLVSQASLPLEVVELAPALAKALAKARGLNAKFGWTVKEFGRRSWYVRENRGLRSEDPARSWKMGSRWWGMRKVPVACSEVGGIYGHYMFKA